MEDLYVRDLLKYLGGTYSPLEVLIWVAARCGTPFNALRVNLSQLNTNQSARQQELSNLIRKIDASVIDFVNENETRPK
jgi:hypothetical protein